MLHLPPAVSIGRFQGGYKSVSDYTDLSDTETSDSKNVVYTVGGDIEKRAGSVRLLKSALTNAGVGGTGRPITGHYHFGKMGLSASYQVVAAGSNLFNFTSSTATIIRSSLTDNSETYWSFVQIQDPRSAADDILLATNGVDAIQLWNGSGTAIALSSLTSATQVPIAKYLLVHKERVYAANITDATDVDAPAKVAVTGFGSDGAADPHRFRDSFYAGGTSKGGDIRGVKVLNDQIFIYTRAKTWKFNPSSGSLGDLQEIQGSVGLLAPRSLVDCGNFHIFLSERGVFAFDGSNFVHLSEKVDDELLKDANLSQLDNACAVFYKPKSQYRLYFPGSGSNSNNRGLVYDLRDGMKLWNPPVTGRQINTISVYNDSNDSERVIYGDYSGFLYDDDNGTNDGVSAGYNGTPTSATYTTLVDSAANFDTSQDGLTGLVCRIIQGTGADQERVITSNTSETLTFTTAWATPPDTTSRYTVGGIDGDWRSKDYNFGGTDITKLFRYIRVRPREDGDYTMTLHYIIDFRDLAAASSRELSLLDQGFAWDASAALWDSIRWGARDMIQRKVSLAPSVSQANNGSHIAVRFSNRRANQTFRVTGFDVEMKAIGKR